MSGQREQVEAAGVELMRGRRTILGRTLAHMLDPMVDALHRRVLQLEGLAASLQSELEAQRLNFEQAVQHMRETQEVRINERLGALEARLSETFNQRLKEEVEHLAVHHEARLEELVRPIKLEQEAWLSDQTRQTQHAAESAQGSVDREMVRFDHMAAELLDLFRRLRTESLKSSLPGQHVSTALLEVPASLPPVSPVPYDTPDHTRALQEEVVQRSYRFTHDPRVAQAAEYDGINLWHCLEAEVSRVLTLDMVEQVRRAGRVVKS